MPEYKSHRSFLLLAASCLWLLAAPPARALTPLADPLELTSTFVPAATFSETSTDSLVSAVDPADHTKKIYSVATKHSTTANITANITGTTLASINAATVFTLHFGGATVTFALGDIPTYQPGQTTAFYCWNGWNSAKKALGTGGVKLTWTATKLTVALTATDEAARPDQIGTDEFIGVDDTPGTFAIKDVLSVDVAFGPIATSVPRTVYFTGSYKVTHATAGPADSPLYDYYLYTVSEAGAADYTRPTVALTTPRQGASVGAAVDVTGTATDAKGLTGVQWTTDLTQPWIATDQFSLTASPLDGLWGSTSATWTVSLSSLPYGTTHLYVESIDDSGNTSLPLLVSLVNPVPVPITGRWDGLLVPATSTGLRGAVTFSLAANGSYTGKLLLEAGSYPFSGSLLADQSMAATISRGSSLPSVALTGTVASFAAANEVVASLAGSLAIGGTGVATFTANRSPFSTTRLSDASMAGSFHVLIAPGADPQGYSYSLVSTARNGAASATFNMADGSVVTWSGVMGAGGELAAFAPMYGGKGSVSVPLLVDGASGTIDATNTAWVRPPAYADKQFPAGFQYSLYTSGIAYHAPSPSTVRVMGLGTGSPNATASWSGDGEATSPSPSLGITVNVSNKLGIPTNPDALQLSLVPSTGLWTGSFKLTGTTTLSGCKMVIVGNQAYGFWVAPAPAHSVVKRYGLIHVQ